MVVGQVIHFLILKLIYQEFFILMITKFLKLLKIISYIWCINIFMYKYVFILFTKIFFHKHYLIKVLVMLYSLYSVLNNMSCCITVITLVLHKYLSFIDKHYIQ